MYSIESEKGIEKKKENYKDYSCFETRAHIHKAATGTGKEAERIGQWTCLLSGLIRKLLEKNKNLLYLSGVSHVYIRIKAMSLGQDGALSHTLPVQPACPEATVLINGQMW